MVTRTVSTPTSGSFCTPTERYYPFAGNCPFRQLDTIPPELLFTGSYFYSPVESYFIHCAPMIPVPPRKALRHPWQIAPSAGSTVLVSPAQSLGIHGRLLPLVILISTLRQLDTIHPKSLYTDAFTHQWKIAPSGSSYAQSLNLTLTSNYTSTSYSPHTPTQSPFGICGGLLLSGSSYGSTYTICP